MCGLASGTTILLQELSQMPNVATHRYRDFPFLMTPWIWSRLVDWGRDARSGRRPNGRIRTGFASRPKVPKPSKSPSGNSSFPNCMRPSPCID